MMKRAFGILVLGLLIAFGCSREPQRENASSSTPLKDAKPIDLPSALAQAKAANKLVLMDFTGSDWCPPCIELHNTIFSKPEFQAYADSNLVFLTVDFPQNYRLPDAASATNDLLSQKFDVEGFPTLVALNSDGKEVWRHVGLIDGGAKELFGELDSAKVKTK